MRLERLQTRLAPSPLTVLDFAAEGEPPNVEDLGRLGVAGVLLCPRFASLGEWELAARQQQVRLLSEVRQ